GKNSQKSIHFLTFLGEFGVPPSRAKLVLMRGAGDLQGRLYKVEAKNLSPCGVSFKAPFLLEREGERSFALTPD
ncbi:MAG: hypothetical protein LBI48_02185, partial [Burkholderiaceae bacterium]|nr:hypothetical protein [Burkholderiaceae bacterium]